MDLLLFVALFAVAVLLAPKRRRGIGACLRNRTDKQYHAIMSMSNWSPDHFRLCEDGEYRNARGEIGKKVSFEEFMNRDSK